MRVLWVIVRACIALFIGGVFYAGLAVVHRLAMLCLNEPGGVIEIASGVFVYALVGTIAFSTYKVLGMLGSRKNPSGST